MAKPRSLLHSILRTPPSPTSLFLIQVEGSTLVQIAEAKTKRMGCFPFSSCLLGPQRGCTAAKGQIQTLMHAHSLSLSLPPSPPPPPSHSPSSSPTQLSPHPHPISFSPSTPFLSLSSLPPPFPSVTPSLSPLSLLPILFPPFKTF